MAEQETQTRRGYNRGRRNPAEFELTKSNAGNAGTPNAGGNEQIGNAGTQTGDIGGNAGTPKAGANNPPPQQ